MKTFDDLVFKPNGIGIQAEITFDNGRGVSVIKQRGSYGYPNKYELAVLNTDGRIDYSTPITSDVLGWLTVEDVTDAMQKVEALD